MKIHGYSKLTLLDYPGTIGATLFTGGCNFRCPFCQNGGLVLSPEEEPIIPEEEIFAFLKKRQGLLEGVCITGGEPTLQPDLPEFITKIRALGYRIKLDTNGYRPRVLKQLIKEGLIDMAAMDIKSSKTQYHKVANIGNFDLSRIEESVDFLKENHIPYEFRTTIVKELHTTEVIEDIGQWLRGSQAYYLQEYKDSDQVIIPGFTPCTKEEMINFQTILKKYIDRVEIRGID
ncbi:MAG: anaerobic ribonucleoside-triphosphate reductase activating protein [Lachnospiraceae bacterium]|nr:anaerobic ribonucleoside-triphosphate reductase activating protein [Lachnospiraceae bacterium]MDD3616265.1 anaerobic ribonucleoside-triphosphate reductase activating protein [Lachnospiraceae bacterium]